MEIGGPEGRNILGKFAEDEVRAFFENFAGWTLLAANRDFCGRGLDFLFGYDDPYSGFSEGVIVDAKHVEDGASFSPSVLKARLAPLYQKMEVFATCDNLWQDDHIRGHIRRLKMGVTALRFYHFDRNRYSATLAAFDPRTIQGSDKVSVMVALANDRLAAFAGLRHFAKGKKIRWEYFRYMENPHPFSTHVLSLPLLMSDLIPGVLQSDGATEHFVLAFQSPSRSFFQFFSTFESHFQFDPHHYLFAQGRADQVNTYSQYLPPDQRKRQIHVIGTDDRLNIDLSRVFD